MLAFTQRYIFGNSSKFERFLFEKVLSELNKNRQWSILFRILPLWNMLNKQVGRGWHKTQGQIQCLDASYRKLIKLLIWFSYFSGGKIKGVSVKILFFYFVIKPSRFIFERNLSVKKFLTLMLGFAVTNGLNGIIHNKSCYYYEEYLSTSCF